jgi:hypothetical protein
VVGIAIGIGIVVGCFMITCGICYVGNILNEWLEQIDQSMMCYLAIMRTQLRIEIADAGYELPEWLEDGFEEENEETPQKGSGQVIQLVKKSKEGEEKDD